MYSMFNAFPIAGMHLLFFSIPNGRSINQEEWIDLHFDHRFESFDIKEEEELKKNSVDAKSTAHGEINDLVESGA